MLTDCHLNFVIVFEHRKTAVAPSNCEIGLALPAEAFFTLFSPLSKSPFHEKRLSTFEELNSIFLEELRKQSRQFITLITDILVHSYNTICRDNE